MHCDGGSKIDLPIEMDDQHRYATSGLLSEELERQNLVLRFSPHKELKAIYAADTYSPDLIRMFLNIFDSMNVNTPRENGLRTLAQPMVSRNLRWHRSLRQHLPNHRAPPWRTELGQNQECLYRGPQARPEETNYLLNSVDQLCKPKACNKWCGSPTRSW